MLKQAQFEDDNADYAAFVEKFKPKKTTDDCYTPENIYNAVADWASKKYGFDKAQIVRPFWPGGDYKRENYPKDCVVLDNPPFSLMTEIVKFYNKNKIRYFLFAPALTFGCGLANYVIVNVSITYENGAVVCTNFYTNLGEYVIEVRPDLRDIISTQNDKNLKTNELPKYEYPNDVVTAARCGFYASHHTPYKLKKGETLFIRRMDAQIGITSIFGGGFLLSERAAAERAAAERSAAERAAAERAAAERAAAERSAAAVWELSPREREIQRMLGSRTACVTY